MDDIRANVGRVQEQEYSCRRCTYANAYGRGYGAIEAREEVEIVTKLAVLLASRVYTCHVILGVLKQAGSRAWYKGFV